MHDHTRRSVPALVAVAAAALLAACGDEGPVSGPGTFTATLLSPNGAEGSAHVALYGAGLGAVGELDGRVFSHHTGDTLRVVVVNLDGGTLRFTVSVADTTRPPVGAVLEVADTEDRLRALAGYALELTR